MKTILVFVSTLNGKITIGNNPKVKTWSSKEDQDYYRGVWKESDLIVMGSTTFDLNRITPSSDRLIVVMTRRPAVYRDYEVKGQLEFSPGTPRQIVEKYRDKFTLMTVVGGPHLATSFLKDQLIDELWLTIEPKLFGRGADLIVPEDFFADLRILSFEKVNEKGTLITRYGIVKKNIV